MMQQISKLLCIAMIILLLSACGGGGSGASDDNPTSNNTSLNNNINGMNAADITVTNTDNDVRAVINRFNTNATSIPFGAPVTLTWNSDGDSCAASGSTAGGQWQGNTLAPSGSQTLTNLTEAGTNSFMLTCVKGGINSEVSSITVNVAPEIDAPTVTLTANPVANIAYNSTTTLTWSSTDTTSCIASGGWTGNRATSNSQGVVINNLIDNTTFTLNCTGPGGTGSSTVAVTVVPVNPSIDFFSAAAVNITEGDSTTLSWQTTDISQCTAVASPALNGWSGTLAPSNINGQVVNNIQTTTTFSLNCVGTDGTTLNENITITAQPPSPTINLAASPSTVDYNGATTLSWTSNHADSCIASGGWTGQKNTQNTQGETINNIVSTTSYTLTCTGAGGSVSATQNINLLPANARITSFTALPDSVDQGGSTILTWQSNDITTCNASATPANSDWSGTVPANSISGVNINNLQQSTIFTLTCTGIDNSSANQSLQVNVNNSMNLAGDAERGRQLYLNPLPGTSFSCADCHGVDGIATFIAPRDINMTPCHEGRCENEEILATYTSNAMPIGTSVNNRICNEQCGRDIAAYLFSEVINQNSDNENSLPIANSSFFNGVSPLPDETVIRKAAILVAGRLPTDAELATAGNRDQMKQALINMMQGPGFDAFIEESINDRFLSNALVTSNTTHAADYTRLTELNTTQRRQDFLYGVRRESQELVKYIVNNNLPYSQILLADYTMVNPETAFVYQANLLDEFPDNASKDDFIRGRVGVTFGGRLNGPFPHAGVLTQTPYLSKWDSTDTNRNRQRARVTADFFLGMDLEALAVRTIETDNAENTLNPTLTNPNCTVCHNTVDPIAGTFQNWANFLHRYRDKTLNNFHDTLARSYVYQERDENGNRYYQSGDLWYRTMRSPGYPFTGVNLPSNRNEDALLWLGEQITSDTRFDAGTVKFWYESLFGRKPIIAPLDGDQNQRLAFDAQNQLFEEIGQSFRASGHDFKNMLSELILSPWFRARTIDSSSNNNRSELTDLGMARILTPEQLNRKILAIFGKTWDELLVNNDYYLTYGAFNSGELDTRNTQLSSLMSSMIDLLSYELTCELVRDDFNKNINDRNLFPFINTSDTPNSNEEAIRKNLVHLHNLILGESLDENDAEISRTLSLLTQVISATQIDNIPPPCNGVNDGNFTQRSWMAVLSYLIGSYEFLYE